MPKIMTLIRKIIIITIGTSPHLRHCITIIVIPTVDNNNRAPVCRGEEGPVSQE